MINHFYKIFSFLIVFSISAPVLLECCDLNYCCEKETNSQKCCDENRALNDNCCSFDNHKLLFKSGEANYSLKIDYKLIDSKNQSNPAIDSENIFLIDLSTYIHKSNRKLFITHSALLI